MQLRFAMHLEFFDSKAVQAKVSKAKRRAFAKSGNNVRMQAKRSIRKRKRSAMPGMPPSSHLGTLKRFIFFAWDSRSESVFVGPVPLGEGVAPARLEHGEDGYQGNPFMGPALEHVTETGGILSPWKDAI